MVAMRNKVEIPDITFTSADFESMDPKQDDPMVITIKVVDCLLLCYFFNYHVLFLYVFLHFVVNLHFEFQPDSPKYTSIPGIIYEVHKLTKH
ncbi:hypothetical protein JHK85_056655 [Glycine max]|nr:hypothetical protein JHK85_056655 [Glycine max]